VVQHFDLGDLVVIEGGRIGTVSERIRDEPARVGMGSADDRIWIGRHGSIRCAYVPALAGDHFEAARHIISENGAVALSIRAVAEGIDYSRPGCTSILAVRRRLWSPCVYKDMND
jgi:hypothetical protein